MNELRLLADKFKGAKITVELSQTDYSSFYQEFCEQSLKTPFKGSINFGLAYLTINDTEFKVINQK